MDTIEIPVTYQNKELCFEAQVVRSGYVNHIVVNMNGINITIERDEEGRYRALADPQSINDLKLDAGLIQAVIEVLESL